MNVVDLEQYRSSRSTEAREREFNLNLLESLHAYRTGQIPEYKLFTNVAYGIRAISSWYTGLPGLSPDITARVTISSKRRGRIRLYHSGVEGYLGLSANGGIITTEINDRRDNRSLEERFHWESWFVMAFRRAVTPVVGFEKHRPSDPGVS